MSPINTHYAHAYTSLSWVQMQEWTPPYLLNGKPRPELDSVPENVTYDERFTFSYRGVHTIDRVVFNRLAGATHGNHFDQRQIVLACSASSSSVGCRSPPNSSVAPPGLYQLFASFEGVPSMSPYVLLQPASGLAPASMTAASTVSQAGR